MKNTPRLLAYCSDNEVTAKHFESDLAKAGISFTSYTCEMKNGSMAKELLKSTGEIYLMVSDNFLKSSQCMVDALELLSNGIQQNRIQAIIVDAMVANSPNGKREPKPTQFSRISDLINYMNFWQEKYLKLRKTKDTIPKGKMDEFEKELKRVRIISAEIGEFLRMLRDTDYWTMEQLQSDHYALFFNKIGKQDLIIPFQKEYTPPKSQEQKIADVKEELQISSETLEEAPTDPEELEAIRLSNLEQEQKETQEIFSTIFDDDNKEDQIETSNLADEGDKVENWEDIEDEDPESELTNKMQARFFERIDQLIENGEEITAARELKQFIQVNKKSAAAHYQLALIESGNESFDQSKYHAIQAVELDPQNSNYHLTLGRILFHHFSDNPKAAEHSFRNAIQLNPANMSAHYEYAMLLHEVFEKPKKAIIHLELTLAIHPEHPFANYDLALIYYSMKKREKAAMYYERAFSVNPELRTPDNDIAFWYESYLLQEETVSEPETNQESKEIYLDPEEALMMQKAQEPESEPEPEELLLEEDNEKIENETLLDDEILGIIDQEEAFKKEAVVNPVTFSAGTKPDASVKTILITGATSGIGKATAKLFAAKGHRLILTGRREGLLNELKSELQNAHNNEITTLDFDVRYLSAAKKSFATLSSEWENIDLLINNAGLAKGLAPIHEGDVKHWEIMLDTNVKGLLFMTRIVSPGMVARGHGQIINVCSSAGHEVYPNGAVYCASKHAVDALTKGIRLDLFKHGIRVGQVSPGHVEETEFAVVRFDGDKDRAKIYNDFRPLTSSDVADAIYYMSTVPSHVTIQDIVMMGTQQASSNFIDRSGR